VREHVGAANLVTSVSLAAGFLALVAVPSMLPVAVGLVVLAALLDVVDGALARRAGGDHTFGAQLDSLADLLCFCVVPAFALQHAAPSGLAGVGVLAGCCVVLAGAWRLSRFPLVRAQGHFVGLPTPAAGVLVLVLVLATPSTGALPGALVLSALMVSSIRFPTVLAAAGVRPGHRAHALRRRLTSRPRPRVPRVLARHRPRSGRRRVGSWQRRLRPAGRVLGTLRRRRDLP
jgi:CDP-diacylglycerol--serine O-phosphatidyltransferase